MRIRAHLFNDICVPKELPQTIHRAEQMLGEKLPFQKNIVYLGPEPNQSAAEELIVSQGGRISDNLISEVADLLLGEKIVGWWQG